MPINTYRELNMIKNIQRNRERYFNIRDKGVSQYKIHFFQILKEFTTSQLQ